MERLRYEAWREHNINPISMNEQFDCSCGGPVQVVSEARVNHACKRKYANLTSYYDGVQRWSAWDRVQVNLKLTNGVVQYNWFAVGE